MTDVLALARKQPLPAAAAIIAVIGALTICGFFFFQYVLGYPPCPLCYEQRHAFYVSVPLAVLLWLGLSHGAQNKVIVAGFAVIAVAMLYNAGLGTYHAGIEWKWWPGPSDCSGSFGGAGSTGDLLKSLQSIRVVRCDEAAWRFLGISLAGYNVVISLGLALVAAWGAREALARRGTAR